MITGKHVNAPVVYSRPMLYDDEMEKDIQYYDLEVLVSDPTLSVNHVVDASDFIYSVIAGEPRIDSADMFNNGNMSFSLLVGTYVLSHDDLLEFVYQVIAGQLNGFIVVEN